jgi:hypothetical protein
VEAQKNMDIGRAVYREKYHGIDPWDDINNFELKLLSPIDTWKCPGNSLPVQILGIDIRCGTPILETRNRLRRGGVTDIRSCAFTTQAKYYLDLLTTDSEVRCDRVDFIQSYYSDGSFDIVTLGEPLNAYPTPVTFLQRLCNLLKRGGLLLFKLRNTNDYNALLRTIGLGGVTDADMPAAMTFNEVAECLKVFGDMDVDVTAEYWQLLEQDKNTLSSLLRGINPNHSEEDMIKLLARDYIFKVLKK